MMNRHPRQDDQDLASAEDNKRGGSKRKSEDGSGSQPRATRNRYISLACNECKRRKIKCNGESPCHRCGNFGLECLYAPNCCSHAFKETEDFRLMNVHIQSLQDQVNGLYANLNALRDRSDGGISTMQDQNVNPQIRPQDPLAPRVQYQQTVSAPVSHPKLPHFKGGPTSSASCFDMAKSSLQTMGKAQPEYGIGELSMEQTGACYDSPPQLLVSMAPTTIYPSKDPLWSLRREEAIRLCRVFGDDIGMMHPIMNIDSVVAKANKLFDFMESARRTGLLSREIERGDDFHDEETNIFKMILAITLTMEGNGESELGALLFDGVRPALGRPVWDIVSLNGLVLLVLVSQYHFHLDQETHAYRIIGLAARLCFEMGLHRSDTLTLASRSDEDLASAMRLFWSIYVLDRRCSFELGIPFAIQDADIDPSLPKPDASSPFLKTAVLFCRISSKVWRAVEDFETTDNETRLKLINCLDSQIRQWQKSIPENLRFRHSNPVTDHDTPSKAIRRYRILTYLRGFHIRIFLHRPILHAATSIMENKKLAQTVVDLAKEMIRFLTELNQNSDIYRTQQRVFNWFLLSSLAVLFLAVAHAPAEFSSQVHVEFYMALDLVKCFSADSPTSKRLWKTIKGLKEIAPKLHVFRHGVSEVEDPHSSAAVAMAGLAGHQDDRPDVHPQSQSLRSPAGSPMDGPQMLYELTELFEAAGGYGGVLPPIMPVDGTNSYAGQPGGVQQGMASISGREADYSKIFKGCFTKGHNQ